MFFGSRFGSIGCVVIEPKALKSMVKPSGVRSAQSWACFGSGSA
jgi:hypothetical protein